MEWQIVKSVEFAENTCYKIKEMWNTPFKPFEPFVQDMFGKCEICFRAGHCTISQCKDQERQELEVINHVINAAHLSARVTPNLLVDFPKTNADPFAVNHVKDMNTQLEALINKGLKKSIALGTTEHLMPKINNLVSGYVQNAEKSGEKTSAKKILNAPIQAPPITGKDISFATPTIPPIFDNAKGVFNKLTENIKKGINAISNLASAAKGKEEKKKN